MPVIKYDPAKEKISINGRCTECDHKWIIINDGTYQLPFELKEKCPKCNHVNILFYPDEEMNRKMLEQKYVLKLPTQLESAKKTIEKLMSEKEALITRNNELFNENKTLVKAINVLTDKLEKLNIKLDGGTDNNPLST